LPQVLVRCLVMPHAKGRQAQRRLYRCKAVPGVAESLLAVRSERPRGGCISVSPQCGEHQLLADADGHKHRLFGLAGQPDSLLRGWYCHVPVGAAGRTQRLDH